MRSFLFHAILFLLICGTAQAAVIEKLPTVAVALTFDACETTTPSFFDEKVLSFLIENKIPFTVFVTGKFLKRNMQRVVEISLLPFVEIENHSMNHRQHMEKLTEVEFRHEIEDLDTLLWKTIGKKSKYFRFPAGNYDAKALQIVEHMNLKVVHWAFASGDPDHNVNPAELRQWVVAKTRPGDVLIFHINGRGYSTGAALPGIVADLQKKGIHFVKLEDARP